jgi:hypothetical protein
MANPTTNFGWVMPTATDLVTDLPADFDVFGQAVDNSLADLKGGTTGQILAKATDANMDFTWIANDQGDITGVTASSPLTGGGTSGAITVGIQDALTTQKGAVQLSDSTSTTSSVLAATPTAVKSAYDLANAAIAKSILDAKGDLITATANDTVARLAVGANDTILTADSSTATGLKWAAPAAGGGMTLLTTTTLSGTSTTSASFATTYKELVCHFYGLNTSASNEIRLRVNSNTGNNYGMGYIADANTSFTQDNGTSGLRVVDYFATVPGYAVGQISIPQYANTSLTSKSCFITQTNTSARRMISIGYITETTAISTLTFYSTSTISGTVLIYGVN